jgi:hypothetical protein
MRMPVRTLTSSAPHGDVAIRERRELADDDVVVALLLEARHVDLAAVVGVVRHVGARHALEPAAAFEISLDDRGHVHAAVGGHRRARRAPPQWEWDR